MTLKNHKAVHTPARIVINNFS